MLARHYGLALGAQALQAGISIIVIFALARLLGPRDFGLNVLLLSAVTVVTVMLTAGMQSAALVLAAQSARWHRELNAANAVAALVLLVLIVPAAVLFAPPVAALLGPDLPVVLVPLTAARVPLTAYAMLTSTSLSGAGRIPAMLVVNLIGTATNLGAVIGAFAAEEPLVGAVFGLLIGNIIWAAAGAMSAHRHLGWSWPPSRGTWRRVFDLGIAVHFGTVAYWIMLRTDAFVLNALVGGPVVGVYGLALSLSERVSIVTTPLYNVVAWRISGPDQAEGLRSTLLAARLEIALGVVITLAVAILSLPVISALAGDSYQDAVVPLTILVAGAAMLPIWAAAGLFLISHLGGAWATTAVQIVVAVLAVVGYVLVIPAGGMAGAALVSTLSYAALATLGLVLIWRRIRFPVTELLLGRSDLAAVRRVLRVRRAI